MDAPVLIISTTVDIATDAVVLELERRGQPFLRINTDAYPYDERATLRLGSAETTLDVSGRPVTPRSVWYRRMRSAARPEDVEPGIHRYCLGEAQTLMRGLGHITSPRVMSQPAAVFRAENKIVQLTVARSLGIRIPDSCISNDPNHVASFIKAHDRVICKPLRSGWFEDSQGEWSIYTTEITPEMLAGLDAVSLAPAIFQKLVPKSCDLRVTIVGDRIFAAEIDSQSEEASKVDWRRTTNPNLPHSICTLPDVLENKLLLLMRELELEFGAIDLVRTPENDYFFLEVNPNGQWLWLDDQLDLGITAEVASWLVRETDDAERQTRE